MKQKSLMSLFALLLFVCFMDSFALGQVRIGVTTALTGYAASYGEDSKRGVELAIDQVNAAGGIRGKKVAIVLEDDAGAGKTGVSAVQKLISVDKVQVIVNGLMSSTALPVAPICRENKVVFIGTMTTHPELTSPGGYIYRIGGSDVTNANAEAKFAYNVLKKKTAASLLMKVDFGMQFGKVVRERFVKLGGSWLITEEFLQGATDFRTQLTKIKDKSPEVLFLVSTHKEGAQILRQMMEMMMKPVVIGVSMFDDPQFIELAGEAAEGVYYYTGAGAATSTGASKKEEEFKAAFKAKFGKDPGITAKYFYDATNIAVEAIKVGGETGPEIDKAMSKIKGYQGVSGVITFNAIGDRIFPATIRRIEKGKVVETGYIDTGE